MNKEKNHFKLKYCKQIGVGEIQKCLSFIIIHIFQIGPLDRTVGVYLRNFGELVTISR